MPIYLVKSKHGQPDRLVKAKTTTGATSFATRNLVDVELADSEKVQELAIAGIKIEDATATEQAAGSSPVELMKAANEGADPKELLARGEHADQHS